MSTTNGGYPETQPTESQGPSDHELVRSLASTKCPACGGVKKRSHTFCSRDYYRLAGPKRNALYNPLGHGYAEAVAAAMTTLGATTFLNPE
jgi:hypothetical protein